MRGDIVLQLFLFYLAGDNVSRSDSESAGAEERQFADRDAAHLHPRIRAIWDHVYHPALYAGDAGMDARAGGFTDDPECIGNGGDDAHDRTGALFSGY